MRKLLLVLFIAFGTLEGFSIDAYFNKGVFMSPNEGMYLETHMLFNASSLRYTTEASGFQAQVELTYIFQDGETVIDYSKNIVRSPFINDTVSGLQDFLDVQRFFLSPGTYQLSIKLRDVNNPIDTGSIVQSITIDDPGNKAFFSDILFVDTVFQNNGKTSVLSRGSVDMIPRISGFTGPEMNELKVYTELYQSDFDLGENQDFLVTIDILESASLQPISEYHFKKRMKSNSVAPLYHSWNIEGLKTEKYFVRYEARNRDNVVMASKMAQLDRYGFMPTADSLDLAQLAETFVGNIEPEDSLRAMLYCLRYRAETAEEKWINANYKKGDTTEIQRFFYEFWHDRNPVDPESAWRRYHNEIVYVEKNFGLGNRRRHACATDRGRTHLYYGKPNTRLVQTSEPSASPYEIWHYYKTPKKSNAKFVFYDPSLVTNDYVMLHSNVPGEQFDPQWYLQLSQPNAAPGGNDEAISTTGNVVDPNNMNNQTMNEVGARALDYWNNPR